MGAGSGKNKRVQTKSTISPAELAEALKSFSIDIHPDPYPQNPREFDNIGTLCTYHLDYDLDDESKMDLSGASWDEVEAQLKTEGAAVIIPLCFDGYGGEASIRVGRPQQGRDEDYGCVHVGFIFATEETIKHEYGGLDTKSIEKTAKYLEGEIEEYNKFLTGDVWGYRVMNEDGETLDSCDGFYGRDYVDKEAEYVAEMFAKSLVEATNKVIRVDTEQLGEPVF